eukprot:COSAG04_NODE_22923_length_347_cov_0.625000_1_plen_21_part_10
MFAQPAMVVWPLLPALLLPRH